MTQSEFGGAQRFIYRLVTNLDLDKYDITVVAGPEGNDANGLLFNLKNKNYRIIALKFLRRGINPLFDLLGFFEIRKLLKKEKPDILFLCSSKAGFLGSWAGKRRAGKIIYRIGGWSFNDPRNSLVNLYLRFLEKFSAKWKDYIINNAESDRQQAIKLGIKPRKEILVIYNGIDIDTLKFYPRQYARTLLGIKSEKLLPGIEPKELSGIKSRLTVGTIANLYPAKGTEFLVEAGRILKNSDIKFVLIGEGRGKKRLRKLITKYGLGKKFYLVVDFFTKISRREADKYLKIFDIFILPSVKEGFPSGVL